MIPNPIRKVLSIFQSCEVRALLMGGQACVFYGAAEFSCDTDFAILAEPENLERLRRAMSLLQAEVIAVPPFTMAHLERGHAVHFRCRHPEADGMRVDVMARMRGVASFAALWERRATIEDLDGGVYELMSLPDLVQAKKTQRDKDWPMIRRLGVSFWMMEARTPELIAALHARFPDEARKAAAARPLVLLDGVALEAALRAEEQRERDADRCYWEPLKRELEAMRRK